MMSTRTLVLPGPHGAPGQAVRIPTGNGLSPRGRLVAWVATIALLLVGALTLAAAGATPITGANLATGNATTDAAAARSAAAAGSSASAVQAPPGTNVTVNEAIVAEWDGPTTHLDWTGQTYATAEASFVGLRVASPGDRVQRTLNIVNDGPSDAVMTVSLYLDEELPAGTVNSELGDAVLLFWDVGGVSGDDTFTRLLARQEDGSLVAEVQVRQGQTVPATIGFELPAEVTEHRNGEAESTALEFLVRVQLQGETAAPELPRLAVTGAQVLGLLALGLGLLGLGWLLWALTRRRRLACDDCAHRIVRGERWSEHHDQDGTRHVQCEACAGPPGSGRLEARVDDPDLGEVGRSAAEAGTGRS